MRFEGYHSDSAIPFKQGQSVVIPAGVRVHSMGSRGDYVTSRKQRVIVRIIMNGQSVRAHTALNDKDYYYPLKERGFDFTEIERLRDANDPAYYEMWVPIHNPTISWAGSGGYWCDVDINDILEANGLTTDVSAAA